MFSDTLVNALVSAAKKNGIDPAGLLALVEVETAGKIFEPADGRTPQLLYERHVAYKEAAKVSATIQAKFVAAGLAHSGWRRATQYKDQNTSAKRLALIAKACRIHDDVALRSASWGVGQTMGFHYRALGFKSAREMVDYMTGSLDAQIDCMIRELRANYIIEPLNAHDWSRTAHLYNGPGYRENQYDTKLRDAHKRWTRRLDTIGNRETPPEQKLSHADVEAIQTKLDELGYHEVGKPDGRWGSRTTGAVSAFQAHEGLPVTGHYDEATRLALFHEDAEPRAVAAERETATAADLKAAGSTTVKNAEQLTLSGRVLQWLGLGGIGTAGADKAGMLDTVKEHLSDFRSITDTLGLSGAWLLEHWYLLAAVAGLFIAWRGKAIVAARIADHQSGRHAGPEGE